jgi:hypothetical protein
MESIAEADTKTNKAGDFTVQSREGLKRRALDHD